MYLENICCHYYYDPFEISKNPPVHLFESCNCGSVDSFDRDGGGGALVDRLEGILHLEEKFISPGWGSFNHLIKPSFRGEDGYMPVKAGAAASRHLSTIKMRSARFGHNRSAQASSRNERKIWHNDAGGLLQVLDLLLTGQYCPKSKSLRAKLPMTGRIRRRSVCRIAHWEEKRRPWKLLGLLIFIWEWPWISSICLISRMLVKGEKGIKIYELDIKQCLINIHHLQRWQNYTFNSREYGKGDD